MNNTPGVILAATTTATVAAVAPQAESPGFVLYVILGVIAGTIWRARYWVDDKGFHRKECLSDLTAMGALMIGGFGVCEYLKLSGWTAGTVAVFSSVIGVEPIRAAALSVMDMWAKSWSSRLPKPPGDDA